MGKKVTNVTGELKVFADIHGLPALSRAKQKYHTQRFHAEVRRNVEWLFTMDEWFYLWNQSGKWKQRGTKKGCYCMCRTNDTGPYSLENVRIDLHGNNVREAGIGNTHGTAHKGRKPNWCPYKTKKEYNNAHTDNN